MSDIKNLEELKKWIKINECENSEDLANAVLSIADEEGEIQGRKKKFKAKKLAIYIEGVILGALPPNLLTREYGIRQQALYIKESERLEELIN
jgi:hypothetical protein